MIMCDVFGNSYYNGLFFNPRFLFLIMDIETIKPSRAAATKLIINARYMDETLLDLWWSELLQLLMFSDGLLAQRARLFKKLLAYASFSNCVGILPVKWLEERLSKVSFRRPSWRGIWPESWFSDKSNPVRPAKWPNFSGISPEILFWRRFRVFNIFHDIISGGREPESWFWSRKRVVK